MLDFALTEEQEAIQHLARSIAVEQLRPQARAAESAGDIALSLLQTVFHTGLISPFPESYGGSGDISAITYALIAEELGFGDGALALNILGSMMGPVTVVLAGDEQQQARYIPAFCDASRSATVHGCLAFAERGGEHRLADVATSARHDGTHYMLTGTKRSVIHGADAQPRVLIFRLAATTSIDGVGACLLPEQVEGLTVAAETSKLGLIAAPSASYTLQDVVIPEHDLLGTPGNDGVMRAVSLYALLRAGIACGIGRAALEYASAYAVERTTFGKPIVAYQSIAFMLAEMAMQLDAARLLLWSAASAWDQRVTSVSLLRAAESAQFQASKLAKSATTDAVQILGGAGFMQDHPVEMWMRNAATLE
ncbi:MAG TPA: acyl-CoA dehydrogenase family protein [Ktedonobacteraceae bacterium]|nr:acyl-CoA dehydrogenase family protein [Ktedonobacteraceae bacterium]